MAVLRGQVAVSPQLDIVPVPSSSPYHASPFVSSRFMLYTAETSP